MVKSSQTSEGVRTSAVNSNNPYSFKAFQSFFSENFSLIIIVILFFVGGFFFGSIWTEKNIYKAGGAPIAGSAGNTGGTTNPSAPQGGRDLSIPALVAKADAMGLDAAELESCINSGETAQLVADDMAGGTAAGVNGTPSTFLVLDGVVVDNVPGALPYDQVKQMIDTTLAMTEPVAKPEFANLPAVEEDDHMRGNSNARLVLVEYSDFECPFCQQFHPTMTQIMAEYENDVAWVYRHYPLSFHPSAQKAGEAAECVARLTDEETFWEYADSLFTN